MDTLRDTDYDDLNCIRNVPGCFTGQFDDDVIDRLVQHGLVEIRYESKSLAESLLGLSRVYIKETV